MPSRKKDVKLLRQKQSEQHKNVPFYDVDRYHSSQPGESRFIVDQLLMQLGPVASWATEQLDEDVGGRLRVVLVATCGCTITHLVLSWWWFP
jgi:hypothetical protein